VGAVRPGARRAREPGVSLSPGRDYLVVHELVHLEYRDNGAAFHEMENRDPLTERARGYLMAIDHAARVD
jgi:hypothetical protein